MAITDENDAIREEEPEEGLSDVWYETKRLKHKVNDASCLEQDQIDRLKRNPRSPQDPTTSGPLVKWSVN